MLIVQDELTKRKYPAFGMMKVIVYKNDNYIEFGYVKPQAKFNYPKINYNGREYYILNADNLETVFSKQTGSYIIKTNDVRCQRELNIYGNGRYPYKIEREYEAEKHIDMFEDCIEETDNTINYDFAKYMKYSFGLEFETAAGYVPEKECFKLGLIPLRDGSISGVEYSTIPLSGNEGFNRLKAQLDCLKEYTVFNKNCSTHIHLGGFPVNEKCVFALHQLWYFYQHRIQDYIPPLSFYTNEFKGNGKNYCAHVNSFRSFKEMYKHYAEQSYLGNMYQPHPADIYKRAKWNIKTRYYNCNFINILCYGGAKTIEFRFLTPTYSFEKLTTFLLFFNALMLLAEQIAKECKTESEIYDYISNSYNNGDISLTSLLDVYPEGIKNKLSDNFEKLYCMIRTQENAGDTCGSRVDIEYKYFPDGQ